MRAAFYHLKRLICEKTIFEGFWFWFGNVKVPGFELMLEIKIPAFVLCTLFKILPKILFLGRFFVAYSLLGVELDDVFMHVVYLEKVLLVTRKHV